MIAWLKERLRFTPVRLALVRRYLDANGAFVGELYRYEETLRKTGLYVGYTMIGASLDTLPLDVAANESKLGRWKLDTKNDFLAPMGKNTIRVGALNPADNDAIRKSIGRIPSWRIRLTVQNRFIERILDAKENA